MVLIYSLIYVAMRFRRGALKKTSPKNGLYKTQPNLLTEFSEELNENRTEKKKDE